MGNEKWIFQFGQLLLTKLNFTAPNFEGAVVLLVEAEKNPCQISDFLGNGCKNS